MEKQQVNPSKSQPKQHPKKQETKKDDKKNLDLNTKNRSLKK